MFVALIDSQFDNDKAFVFMGWLEFQWKFNECHGDADDVGVVEYRKTQFQAFFFYSWRCFLDLNLAKLIRFLWNFNFDVV